MLRFYTAGESHGQALLAFVSGLPASLPIDVDFINHELHRRQLGYGRGGRQKIEKDRAEIFAGVRHGKTIGAPVALRIENRDWANWEKILPVEDSSEDDAPTKKLVAPRPGHADLAGSQKFNFHDARYILERASARETAARVAAGALAKQLLRALGTEIASHTIQVGHTRIDRAPSWDEIQAISKDLESPLRCEVQDEIFYDRATKKFSRSSNRACGLEGGITNGEDVVVRGYLKPISTLRRALKTANMITKEPVQAAYERSDWCVVHAGAVAAEAMVALVLADAFLQKFGGDSLPELLLH